MISERCPHECGLLAAIVALRRWPSRPIASCRKWATFGYQRPDMKDRGKISMETKAVFGSPACPDLASYWQSVKTRSFTPATGSVFRADL